MRSALEREGEGRPLPRQPRSLAVPLSEWASEFDAAAGKRKVVKPAVDAAKVSKVVAAAAPSQPAGLVVLCSGVPDPAAGGLRAALAAEALRPSAGLPVTVLEGGYAAWALKWTNKAERRVVGFVISSGGTSIEQKGGEGSKGSGVSGKGVEDLLQESLVNYGPGGMYA